MKRRKRPTLAQRAQIIADQNGRCAITGEEFVEGDEIEFDHIDMLELSEDNSLANFQAVLSSAHKCKTRVDRKLLARIRHLRRETGQQARRGRRGHGLIQSRGFSKTLRKRMDGSVQRVTP